MPLNLETMEAVLYLYLALILVPVVLLGIILIIRGIIRKEKETLKYGLFFTVVPPLVALIYLIRTENLKP